MPNLANQKWRNCMQKTQSRLSITWHSNLFFRVTNSNRIKDKYIFLYYYALLNLRASLNMKKKDFLMAFQLYSQIENMLQTKDTHNTEVEIEKAHLLEDAHIIKYNMANSALVKSFFFLSSS
jgi:hypothetical protein